MLNISAVKPIDKDGYIESCGLMVEQNLMNFNLEEFYQIVVEQDEQVYSPDYEDFSVVKQGRIVLNDVDFLWNSYKYGNVQTLNFYATSNKMVYRVMFLSYQEHFDSLVCNYTDIARSLKIGKN